jgi:hypothetical protein
VTNLPCQKTNTLPFSSLPSFNYSIPHYHYLKTNHFLKSPHKLYAIKYQTELAERNRILDLLVGTPQAPQEKL